MATTISPSQPLRSTSEEFLRRRPSWRSSSAKPTRSGDECKTSGHTFKGQVGHLTLTIHTQSIQFASHYSNFARDSHRGRCRHTSKFLGEPIYAASLMRLHDCPTL